MVHAALFPGFPFFPLFFFSPRCFPSLTARRHGPRGGGRGWKRMTYGRCTALVFGGLFSFFFFGDPFPLISPSA